VLECINLNNLHFLSDGNELLSNKETHLKLAIVVASGILFVILYCKWRRDAVVSVSDS